MMIILATAFDQMRVGNWCGAEDTIAADLVERGDCFADAAVPVVPDGRGGVAFYNPAEQNERAAPASGGGGARGGGGSAHGSRAGSAASDPWRKTRALGATARLTQRSGGSRAAAREGGPTPAPSNYAAEFEGPQLLGGFGLLQLLPQPGAPQHMSCACASASASRVPGE